MKLLTKNKFKLGDEEAIKKQSVFVKHNKEQKEELKKPVPTLMEENAWLFAPYLDKAIRTPETFNLKSKSKNNRDKHILQLMRHMFCKYPLAYPFKEVWINSKSNQFKNEKQLAQKTKEFMCPGNDTIDDIDFRLWSICVGSGGSLYKQYAKTFLTKKEVHILTNCPHEISMEEALVYAIAKAGEADEGTALKLSKSKIKTLLHNNVTFWKRVITFFIVHHDCPIMKLNDFIDFIHAHRQNEAYLFNMLNGATLNSLSVRMEEWHRALGRAKILGNYTWIGAPIANSEFKKRTMEDKEVIWKFHQILNTKELGAEGTRMRHCVLSYKDRCINGDCSIWSLSLEKDFAETPKITIELSSSGRIVQARGFANRTPKNDEWAIIKEWASKEGLQTY